MEPIDYSPDPIGFVNQMVKRHRVWLRGRNSSGESLRYMREAVDQVGRGRDFVQALVWNDAPKNADPHDPRTDLSLLQLYQYWRDTNGFPSIEPWDGSRLRPWLPSENNPQVPGILTGDMQHFHDAWSRFHPGQPKPDPYKWDPIDAFGLEIEKYFSEVRSHSTWSRPLKGGKMRFYRFNELNNFEVAPYSIRFWGFLKWCDSLRRTMLGEKVEEVRGGHASDIAFMDEFNQSHFAWHDDVFENGKCDTIENQFGQRKRHKYPMNRHGYAVEFLDFHRDLLVEYNKWRSSVGMPKTADWLPDEYNSAHILKLAFGGPWGLGNSNGDILDIETYAPELADPSLSAFKTGAELGYYLENCGIAWHGMGHVQNCDIRDVYTNNYSIRFFGWHQWIDSLYQKILDNRPKFDKTIPLSDILPGFCDDKAPFPPLKRPFEGHWTYRSYKDVSDPNADNGWFVAEMRLAQTSGTDPFGKTTDVVVGELDSGHPDYRYRLSGHLDVSNVNYEIKPPYYDERTLLIMEAHGMTEATRGHVYRYVGHYAAPWPTGKDQMDVFTGSMIRAVRPDDETLEGTVGSFQSVRKSGAEEYFYADSVYVVPEGVDEILVELWGAGGGGGSDGPGIGGLKGQDGGATRISKLGGADALTSRQVQQLREGVRLPERSIFPFTGDLFAAAAPLGEAGGGAGGDHGVNQIGKGGAGGVASRGTSQNNGEAGKDGEAEVGKSGAGGNSPEADGTGLGGHGVGPMNSGNDGLFPGGGGSGAQMAHSPAGGGGSGAYLLLKLDVKAGEAYEITVGKGGVGGAEGFANGGSGADGVVRLREI